jgi:hypothetical protein
MYVEWPLVVVAAVIVIGVFIAGEVFCAQCGKPVTRLGHSMARYDKNTGKLVRALVIGRCANGHSDGYGWTSDPSNLQEETEWMATAALGS